MQQVIISEEPSVEISLSWPNENYTEGSGCQISINPTEGPGIDALKKIVIEHIPNPVGGGMSSHGRKEILWIFRDIADQEFRIEALVNVSGAPPWYFEGIAGLYSVTITSHMYRGYLEYKIDRYEEENFYCGGRIASH